MATARLFRRPRTIVQLLERHTTPIVPLVPTRSLRTRPGKEHPSESEPPPGASSAQNAPHESQPQQPPPKPPDLSAYLSKTSDAENNLLAPVHIPEDPNAVLRSDHPATDLLTQSGVVVQRQIEMMNVFLGFEQANRYVILDPHGNHIGYIAEFDGGMGKAMGRQMLRTHRAFTAHVFDRHQQEVLRFHRPISMIKTKIRVYDPWEVGKSVPKSSTTDVSTEVKDHTLDGMHQISQVPMEAMRIIGEAHSEWAPLRRKYNLFLAHELPESETIGTEAVPDDLSASQQTQVRQQPNFAQFAYIDEPFLSWDFSLKGADDRLIGSVNRNWRGFGRELFTDTGAYALRMDSAGLEEEADQRHIVSQSHKGERGYAEVVGATTNGGSGMTLDQRAVMLATAVTVDFDYFSRHSNAGGIMPMPIMMGGGGAAEAGGAAGAAGAGAEAGVIGETVGGGAVGAAGRAAGAAGAGEGAMAGAGTMAGYEAMQRGLGRGGEGESATDPNQPYAGASDPQSPQYGNELDPQSPQYGGGSDPQSSTGYDEGQSNDVWGSGDSDPWQEGSSTGGGGGGDGEGGGGLISQLWDAFFGD